MMLKRLAVAALCLSLGATTAGLADTSAPAAAAGSAASPAVSIWDGVFTADQAMRGKQVAAAVCSRCHGPRLDGAHGPDQPEAPPIARYTFLSKWDGQTVDSLLGFVKSAMPPQSPGSLTDQQYIDVISYMFQLSNAPAGQAELKPDPAALAGVVIKAER
jgi:cytochrome c5